MPQLYVLVMICGVSQPVCDQNTARAYQAFIAPPGIVVCGLPATVPFAQSVAGPDESEYLKTRCELR